MLTRRRFLQTTGAGLLAWPSFLDARADSGTFYVGILADTHLIDDFYRGPEGNVEDTESIFQTRDRLIAARAALNALTLHAGSRAAQELRPAASPGRLELRVEAFNVLNRSNFNPPNGNRSATAFGTITQIATGTTPRQVQLGVKVYF